MSKPIIYGHEMSSVVRSVLMVAKAINLDYEYKEVDFDAGDNVTEHFLKMNPLHTVPTMDDDGLYLGESHAIGPYLIQQYGKNDDLYPRNDLRNRARIDQMLHFDNGILYWNCIRGIVMPIYNRGAATIAPAVLEEVDKAYGFMEKFLEADVYLVGDSLTVADLACGASISSLFELVPADPEKYPNLHAWFKRIKGLPYYEEANGRGNARYIEMLESKRRKEGE